MKTRSRAFKLSLVAALVTLAVTLVVVLRHPTPEVYYHNRSTSSWIRDVLCNVHGVDDPIPVFNALGTNAEPFLKDALLAKRDIFFRVWNGCYDRLPYRLQEKLPMPYDPALIRMAAVIVLQRNTNAQLLDHFYPLLAQHDSGLRHAVLDALSNNQPTTNQISYLVMAATDDDPFVCAEAWKRLAAFGPSAASVAPQVKAICDTSTNMEIRHDAAWTLWKMTGQTNTPLPILEIVLRSTADVELSHAIAHDLLLMHDTNAGYIACLIQSLAKGDAADRSIVCYQLGLIGPPAAAAIPALREATRDTAQEVRRRAEVALGAIEQKHAVD